MRKASPDLLLLLVAFVWGGSYLSAKNLVAEVGVEPALALRYGIGALGMLGFALIRRTLRAETRLLLAGVALGCSQAGILWLETAGVSRTSATNAGILISLSLILTPLLEAALLQRRLPPPFYLAASGAVLGIALLASGTGGLRMPTSGDLLVLGAAILRAAHVTATARVLRKNDSVVTLVTVQMLVGAVFFALLTAPSVTSWGPQLTLTGFANSVFLGLGCSVFAFLVQAWAVQHTSAARAALLMGTEPLWAALIGITIGAELLGIVQLLGASLIIAGSLTGSTIERRSRERRAEPQSISARSADALSRQTKHSARGAADRSARP